MRTFGICFLTIVCMLVMQSWLDTGADAAALSPPSGWYPSRERMNYALGQVYGSVGTAVGTTEITVSGMVATDHILFIANLTDPTETQLSTANVTAASGKVSFASGSANGEKYLVCYKRPRPDWSN